MTATLDDLKRAKAAHDPWGRSPESSADYDRAKAALDERAQNEWDNPEFHREIAAELKSELDYQFTFENLFSTFLSVDTVGQWDQVRLRELRGLKAFYTARNGYIEESQIRTEDWTLPRDTIGFHVAEFADKLQNGFAEQLEAVISLGGQRLEAEINRRMFNLLQAAIPNGSAYYTTTAGLTKPQLDTAIRQVKDAIKPNGQGPTPVTVIGRASMIDQISDFNLGFDPEATSEIRAKGRLGVYRAANIVQVVNYTDELGLPYIPANELWIFGGQVGKFVKYGGLNVKTWEEDAYDYRHYKARQDIGGLIHHPEQARRIVDSSVVEP